MILKNEDIIQNLRKKDRIVYNTLRGSLPITRPELSELTGIPTSTLYYILNRLILRGLIKKDEEKNNKKGRPRIFYEIIV
jgi:predicted transcriptional regulator